MNLLGGHTDYNDGLVLPVATSQSTYVAASRRSDRRFRVWSSAYDETHEFTLDDCRRPTDEFSWSDYSKGVIGVLAESGIEVPGFDAAIVGDLPIAVGVSSSASFEIAVAQAALALAQTAVDRMELAFMAQRAEARYVGVQCGVLDQFAALFGQKEAALLIDCRSYDIRPIPFGAADVAVVVCDTNKPRGLVESEYNLRRQQCEAAADGLGVTSLREATTEQVVNAWHELGEKLFRRARHVTSENQRVADAADALSRADFDTVGMLMLKAHESLRDDYEVSCTQLDAMVDLAAGIDGCFGARLVGAGFGGSAVALINARDVRQFCQLLESQYQQETGLEGQTFVTWPANGAEIVYNGTSTASQNAGGVR